MKFNHLNVPSHWKSYWTRYPEGHTILEALISWVSQVDSMVDNQNKLNTNVEQFRKEIDEFVGRFDERLQDEVTHTLNDWQTSGFLDVVISEALQWELDNYKATNEQDKLSITTQLQQKVEKSTFEQFELSTNEYLSKTTPYIITNTMSQIEIQNALNTYKKIKFLSGTYSLELIDGIGLDIPSNREIEFENGAILEAKATNLPTYHILRLRNVENVTLISPVIKGERATHTGVGGEWGFGISLEKTKNITLIKPKCSDCWGDGIYLGDLNENVTIDRPICDNNRRQGISVIACKTLTIIDPILTNTNGTDPQSGIDFEPNLGTSGLENVRLINPYTGNNAGMGIVITLVNLGGTNKVVDITIENHKDVGSRFAMYVGACDNLKGSIVVNNPLWVNNKKNAFIARDYTATAPLFTVKSPTIINPHRLSTQTELNDPRYGSDISLYREGGDTTTNPLGGIILDDISIQNDTVSTYAGVAVRDELSSKKVTNFQVRNPIRFGLSKRHLYSNVGVYPIKGYDFKTAITVDTPVTATDVIKNYTNAGATGLVKLTLQEGTPIGCKVSVQIESNHPVEIIPFSQSIAGESTAPQRLSSDTVGSRLIIEKVASNLWSVVRKTGTWTVS